MKQNVRREHHIPDERYLHKAAQALASWLSVMLPKSGEDWWEECVLSNLSYPQRELIEKKGLSKLEE